MFRGRPMRRRRRAALARLHPESRAGGARRRPGRRYEPCRVPGGGRAGARAGAGMRHAGPRARAAAGRPRPRPGPRPPARPRQPGPARAAGGACRPGPAARREGRPETPPPRPPPAPGGKGRRAVRRAVVPPAASRGAAAASGFLGTGAREGCGEAAKPPPKRRIRSFASENSRVSSEAERPGPARRAAQLPVAEPGPALSLGAARRSRPSSRPEAAPGRQPGGKSLPPPAVGGREGKAGPRRARGAQRPPCGSAAGQPGLPRCRPPQSCDRRYRCGARKRPEREARGDTGIASKNPHRKRSLPCNDS